MVLGQNLMERVWFWKPLLPPHEPSISDHYRHSAVFHTDLWPKDYNAQLNYIPYEFRMFLHWLQCVVLWTFPLVLCRFELQRCNDKYKAITVPNCHQYIDYTIDIVCISTVYRKSSECTTAMSARVSCSSGWAQNSGLPWLYQTILYILFIYNGCNMILYHYRKMATFCTSLELQSTGWPKQPQLLKIYSLLQSTTCIH